jgi:hypothetical protein
MHVDVIVRNLAWYFTQENWKASWYNLLTSGDFPMDFITSPICTSQTNCFHCRNNKKFRTQMEQQYGSWECPDNISIGAKLEELPQKAQDAYMQQQKMQTEQRKKIEEAQIVLDELEMIVPPEGKEKINKIRSLFLPQTKTVVTCKNGGDKIGEVDEECCGGTIKKVDAFKCLQHTLATNKKCQRCPDFAKE